MPDANAISSCMLEYRLNGQAVAVHLDRPVMVIGRSSDCDIHLDYVMASRRHARLMVVDGSWLVEDLQSRNGIVVNGRRVERERLRHGDVIRVGDLELRFIDIREASACGAGPVPYAAESEEKPGDERTTSLEPLRFTTRRGAPDREYARPRDEVDCTVFAPPSVARSTQFLVQVFAHLPEEAEGAARDAVELDEDARRRGATTLGAEVGRGSTLTFALTVPGANIDEPVRDLVWRGRRTSVQFGVTVPARDVGDAVFGTVVVSQNSIPIGSITFKVKTGGGGAAPPAPAGQARRYTQAFISYASRDRAEVMRRVQMLKSVGISIFQDVLNLEPGERWAERLYHWIDRCDVMFLFWSTAAQQSEWVTKEWEYALERKGDEFIRPVGIEGPPVPEPPEALRHLHFGDPLLYFIGTLGT